MCSHALIWGMSYNQFWSCKWGEFFSYRRKYEIEQEMKAELLDTKSWQQAVYISLVLQDVFPLFNPMVDHKKKIKPKFPKQPYLQIEKSKRKKKSQPEIGLEERIQKHNMEIATMNLNPTLPE